MPLPFFSNRNYTFSPNYQEIEKTDLNLNNPIFVAYVDVKNLPSEIAEQLINRTRYTLDIYNNVTFWIIASDETRIECVYDGQCKTRDMELNDLIKEINTRIDIMSKSNSFEDFKINIREWRINELVNGLQEKQN